MSKALYAFIGLAIAASLIAPASAAIDYTSSRSNTGNLCARAQSTPHPGPTRKTHGANTVSSRSNTGGNNGCAHPTHTSGPINAINYNSSKSNTGNINAKAHPTHTTGPINSIDYNNSKSNTGNINAKAHPTHTTGPINSINYNASKSNTGNFTFTGSRSNQTQNSRKAATKATPGSKPAQGDWQAPPTR